MSLAGFDFQALNRKYLAQPANDAANYGASIVKAPAGDAWRCIGIYHLKPSENNRRHNVFVEVLDEQGNRTRLLPAIKWTWWMDAPLQTLKLDKPDNEPAADIPINPGATITLYIDGFGLPSDSVGNLRASHADEGPNAGNAIGHHSFYVVFQLKRSAVVTPPVEPTKPPISDGSSQDQRLSALEAEVMRLTANQDALWKVIDAWQGGK